MSNNNGLAINTPILRGGGISHIALMVSNLEFALTQFLMLGYKQKDRIIVAEEHGTKVVLVENGSITIELIEPITEEKILFYQDRIKKFGYFMDHICYYCDNIEETCTSLKEYRFFPSTKITKSPVLDNKRTIFLVNRKMGIIELVEKT